MKIDQVFIGNIYQNDEIIKENVLLYQLGLHGYYAPKLHRIINDIKNKDNILYVQDLTLFNYSKLKYQETASKLTIKKLYKQYLQELKENQNIPKGSTLNLKKR